MNPENPNLVTDLTAIAQPLLPHNKKDDRPLFMVLVILSFLATLTLLAVASGCRAAAGWHTNLDETVTVQIKPRQTKLGDNTGEAEQAKNIIIGLASVRTVTILSGEHSKALLKPWLGDVSVPDDLPLPTLLDLQLNSGQVLNIEKLKTLLSASNIRADIDDHSQWDKEIKRTTATAQLLSFLALSLIIIASIAASIFATNAGLTGQRRLMDVLHQVGAPPAYTARLFSTHFALSGFKAGAIGALAALLVSVLVEVLFAASSGFSYFLPGLHLSLADIYLVIAVPIVLALITAVTSWRTVVKTLYNEIYP